ncbi:MAG: hypothetical protein EOP45_20745, partial [Sphingobacteriaceae bacterium]
PTDTNVDKANQAAKLAVIKTMHGFKNHGETNRNACYANSVIQCLFNIDPVRNKILTSTDCLLKQIFMQYDALLPGESMDLITLRRLFYDDLLQQDCTEFLQLLLQSDVSCGIADLCRFALETPIKCSRCDYMNLESQPNTTYALDIKVDEANRANCSITELMQSNLNGNWRLIDAGRRILVDQDPENQGTKCRSCRNRNCLQTRTLLKNPGEVLIFYLKLYNDSLQKTVNVKLSGVSQNDIEVGSVKYTLSGAVFHSGNTMNTGHYYSILRRNGRFIMANDEGITECRWPNNSKEIYMLIYVKKTYLFERLRNFTYLWSFDYFYLYFWVTVSCHLL